MRAPLLTAAATLALCACSSNDQRDNVQNVDESLTAENIASNDVTAIDAVTAQAANMAAHAEIDDIGAPADNASTQNSSTTRQPASRAPRKAPPAATSTANSSTASNSTE